MTLKRLCGASLFNILRVLHSFLITIDALRSCVITHNDIYLSLWRAWMRRCQLQLKQFRCSLIGRLGPCASEEGVWPLQLSSMGLPVAPQINSAAPQAELSPEGETQTKQQFGEFG